MILTEGDVGDSFSFPTGCSDLSRGWKESPASCALLDPNDPGEIRKQGLILMNEWTVIHQPSSGRVIPRLEI